MSVTAMTIRNGPVRAGFDPDDEDQERAIGIWWAEKQRPGDRDHARSRARQRVARHRKKELEWRRFVTEMPRTMGAFEDRLLYDVILIRELLELLPVADQTAVIDALNSGDERLIVKAGRLVREKLPGTTSASPPPQDL